MRTDLAAYAAECLMIRTKSGEVRPLVFNRAQRHIHAQLEAQRAATGKVRALILKGRQQGCTTYVGGRFFHRATHEHGIRVFILTHEDAATQNLFEMVERFHDHCPPEREAVDRRRQRARAFLRRARLRLQDRHRRHQGGGALLDHPAVPRLGGRVLAARRDACGRHPAGGAGHSRAPR